jgi:hypothetical protein
VTYLQTRFDRGELTADELDGVADANVVRVFNSELEGFIVKNRGFCGEIRHF